MFKHLTLQCHQISLIDFETHKKYGPKFLHFYIYR
jgi:hypothetical protein